MKKILMAFGLISAMLSCQAMAQSTKGLMFGGTVGFAKPHGSDNDSGTIIGGRLSQQIQGNVSWEADLNLGVTDGTIAIIGGTEVFSMFLPLYNRSGLNCSIVTGGMIRPGDVVELAE